MAKKKGKQSRRDGEHRVSASVDELLTAALRREDESLETGRYIVTYKENATKEAQRSLKSRGLRVADARDFKGQAVTLDAVGDADAVVFPGDRRGGDLGRRIRRAWDERPGGDPRRQPDRSHRARVLRLRLSVRSEQPVSARLRARRGSDRAGSASRGGGSRPRRRSARARRDVGPDQVQGADEPAQLAHGIKVAVLDTGMDLGHPDFAGRTIVVAELRRRARAGPAQPRHALHRHRLRAEGAGRQRRRATASPTGRRSSSARC